MTISAGSGGSAGADGGCWFDLSVAIGRPPADVYAFLADIQDAEPLSRRVVIRMVLWLVTEVRPSRGNSGRRRGERASTCR